MVNGGGGVDDAFRSLGADRDDWLIRLAIIRSANDITVERRRAEIEALGAIVGARVGESVGQLLKNMFR